MWISLASDYDAMTAKVAYQDALPFMSTDAHMMGHQDYTQQEEEANRDKYSTREETK